MSLADWVPGIATARSYRRSWLGRDVAAGLVLTALLVPAGMGYAEVAGLPPITGLYATMVPLIVYAVLGPSRILVLGPDSAVVPLIFATIVPLAGADPAQRLALAGALSVMVGLLCIGAGLLKAGFITELLSTPVRLGYLNGLATVILASQLPKLFGIPVDATGTLQRFEELLSDIRAGDTDTTALVIGTASLVVMLACRRWLPRVPGALVVVVGAILAVELLGLDGDLKLVGELPQGLPSFAVPDVSWSDLTNLVAGAVSIAFVAFADTSVLSRTYAERLRMQVDPNRELMALGAVNVVAGFFQGFAVSGSASRTPAAEAAGAKTQLTSVVAAAGLGLLLVFFPGVFASLPVSVLAAVVIVAAISLVDVRGVARLWWLRRGELLLSMTCFLGVVVLGVIKGIGLAVLLALGDFVRRAWRPHTAVLVRVDGLKGYHEAERHPEGRHIPGLVLYRFDAPLFFANAEWFRTEVRRLVEHPQDGPVRWVVITAEPITDIDTTAGDALVELRDDLARRDVVLAFAELKGHTRERLDQYGLTEHLGPDHFFRTIGEAVKAYVHATGVTWVDWEDRGDRTP